MPIKKRLTPQERIKRQLPVGWRSAFRHPLLGKLVTAGFDPTPENIVKAINLTKSWKGANWQQKVVVQSLDLLLEKAYGRSILDPDTYNRLQDHLHSNENKMQAADWQTHHVWVWDVYHDHYKLQDMENGDLELPANPKPKRKVIKKPVIKKKRRKLRKHS